MKLLCRYRVSNYRLCLLYALVCKGCAFHKLFSYIIMKLRHETNCWSWFWVYNSNQKWKILKMIFFFQFFFVKKFFQVFQFFWIFDSLMFRIFLKWPNLKYLKKFFLYFLNFSFLIGFMHPKSWPKNCLMSYYHDQTEKSMWNAYPLHT